jgi:hypothetical protein
MFSPSSKKLKGLKSPVSGENSKYWSKLTWVYYGYNSFIVIVGSCFIVFGYNQIDNGVSGRIEWIVKLFGNESSLKHATPGVFLMLIGFFIILFARDKVGYHKTK